MASLFNFKLLTMQYVQKGVVAYGQLEGAAKKKAHQQQFFSLHPPFHDKII